MQSQRFALQELLKQFLLIYLYYTSFFLFHKKVQSQRFALQELLKQFLLVYRYCTSNFLFHKKDHNSITTVMIFLIETLLLDLFMIVHPLIRSFISWISFLFMIVRPFLSLWQEQKWKSTIKFLLSYFYMFE